jgi:putative transcriptional regulator
MIIKVRIDELLEEHGRSFYWLSKQTGVSHTTLWRLKKGKALGINFVTLEKICAALECEPGDVLKIENQTETGAKKAAGRDGSSLKTKIE